eukprot:6079082-Pyramimonas_sp.AAC.1
MMRMRLRAWATSEDLGLPPLFHFSLPRSAIFLSSIPARLSMQPLQGCSRAIDAPLNQEVRDVVEHSSGPRGSRAPFSSVGSLARRCLGP